MSKQGRSKGGNTEPVGQILLWDVISKFDYESCRTRRAETEAVGSVPEIVACPGGPKALTVWPGESTIQPRPSCAGSSLLTDEAVTGYGHSSTSLPARARCTLWPLWWRPMTSLCRVENVPRPDAVSEAGPAARAVQHGSPSEEDNRPKRTGFSRHHCSKISRCQAEARGHLAPQTGEYSPCQVHRDAAAALTLQVTTTLTDWCAQRISLT